MKKLQLGILLLVLTQICLAQADYNIDFNHNTYAKKCNKCIDSLHTLPEDVKLILQQDGNEIYFGISDKRWFKHIFNSKHIGVAIDVVTKQDFSCNDSTQKSNRQIKGILSKPIYRNEILKKNISYDKNIVYSPIFELPADLQKNEDLEFNLLILYKKQLCQYIVFWSMEGSKLAILDMDLYLDSLSASNIDLDSTTTHSQESTFKKTMFFTIPFQKDKYTYRPEDIQPIIDSLALTDYEIKKIDIKAFASVEGTSEHNLDLQKRRANSIGEAIQSFQTNTFQININSSENWNAFKKDIGRTKYSYLKGNSRDAIKQELQNKQIAEDLEPMLANHRKGMIRIELEKKVIYDSASSTQILKDLNQAFLDKNKTKANELMDIIFANVETKIYSPDIIQDINIPQSLEYGEQLLKKEYLSTQNSNIATPELYQKFLDLESYAPNNALLKYNLRMLEIKLFAEDERMIDRKNLALNLQNLSKYKQIDARLVKRLFINYHILLGEYYNEEQEYKLKNVSLSYIYNNFKKLKSTDTDLYRLSNYFVIYSKRQWAVDLIKNKVKLTNASEDLVFQYIHLTILDSKLNSSPFYQELLQRASSLNNQRLCNIYQCTKKGGISFQLLDFNPLKTIYCQECID